MQAIAHGLQAQSARLLCPTERNVVICAIKLI